MATLVSDLINQSFVDLGVIQPGETISATMQTAAFAMLNQLLSAWSTEQTMAYQLVTQGFSLTPGTSLYSLGVGGNLSTAQRVVRVTGWRSTSGNFVNGGEPISFEQFYATVKDPTAKTSVLAEVVAADFSFPLINILVWPPPATAPGALGLRFWSPLTAFGSISDTVTLPDGWEQALHFNLAIVLSPQYARVGGVTPELAANAQNSKGAIVAKNAAILGQNQAPPAAA